MRLEVLIEAVAAVCLLGVFAFAYVPLRAPRPTAAYPTTTTTVVIKGETFSLVPPRVPLIGHVHFTLNSRRILCTYTRAKGYKRGELFWPLPCKAYYRRVLRALHEGGSPDFLLCWVGDKCSQQLGFGWQ